MPRSTGRPPHLADIRLPAKPLLPVALRQLVGRRLLVDLRLVVDSRLVAGTLLCAGLAGSAVAPAGLQAQDAAGESPASAEAPNWLAGCWQAEAGALIIEEHWMTERAGTLLGMSRTTRGDRPAGYELVLIRRDEGGWTYQAHPSGQASAEFRASSVTDTSIVFSNVDHDFPQHIAYHAVGGDSLVARISGERDGVMREIDFPYREVSCPGSF